MLRRRGASVDCLGVSGLGFRVKGGLKPKLGVIPDFLPDAFSTEPCLFLTEHHSVQTASVRGRQSFQTLLLSNTALLILLGSQCGCTYIGQQ